MNKSLNGSPVFCYPCPPLRLIAASGRHWPTNNSAVVVGHSYEYTRNIIRLQDIKISRTKISRVYRSVSLKRLIPIGFPLLVNHNIGVPSGGGLMYSNLNFCEGKKNRVWGFGFWGREC